MAQGGAERGLAEFAAEIQDPECLQRGGGVVAHKGAQGIADRVGMTCQEAPGLFAEFAVGSGEGGDEFGGGKAAEIADRRQLPVGGHDAENASVGFVPGVGGVEVAQPQIGPVGDVNGSVGALLDVNRAEALVFGRDERVAVDGAEA